MTTTFETFFGQATGVEPFPYQVRFATVFLAMTGMTANSCKSDGRRNSAADKVPAPVGVKNQHFASMGPRRELRLRVVLVR